MIKEIFIIIMIAFDYLYYNNFVIIIIIDINDCIEIKRHNKLLLEEVNSLYLNNLIIK